MNEKLAALNTAADPVIEMPKTAQVLQPESWRTVKDVPMSFRLILQLASRIQIGGVTFVLPDGRAFKVEGKEPGPHGVMIVRSFGFAGRTLRGGNTGFGEAYVSGEWDSPDPPTLIEVISRNSRHYSEILSGKGLVRFIQELVHKLRKNTKAGSKRNIHAHYDLGNEFYSQWLDPTMTYSSARFTSPTDDLSKAQLNKYRSLARAIGLKPEHHVLEIGCGWGGFAEFAAGEVGCKVTGITISREQLAFAKQRMKDKGLADRVELRFQDYRDVTDKFDRVASIEMFEAVGREYWPAYFNKVREVLKPGGAAGIQVITIRDDLFEAYKNGTDFIQRYIFPGGMLPSPGALKEETRKAGLEWDGDIAFGLDYAKTLAGWRDRFIAAWPKIERLGFDERFQRIWKCYLQYCEGGFRAGSLDVMQIALKRS